MPTLQHLDNRQIDEAILAASQRQVPVTITVRKDGGWANLRSRLLATRDGHLWLAIPTGDDGTGWHEFHPADKAGVSFKLRHHKHIFTGTVACVDEADLPDGSRERVLQVCSPTRMQRLQRRAFQRVDVPPNRIVRVSLWIGGRQSEPVGGGAEQPIWTGRVLNLSAGGFQAICDDEAAAALDVGETVGVRLRFGAEEAVVYADAQYRHHQPGSEGSCLGFQFVGLGQTPEGRQALQAITLKTAQYQREL